MRTLVPVAALLALAAVASAQKQDPTVLPPPTTVDRPGQIVIEPKKPSTPPALPHKPGTVAVLKGTDPDRPGFIVFSPNVKAASALLPIPSAASRVEMKDGVPHVVIVGEAGKPAAPGRSDPPSTKPTQGSKPAEPEKVEDGKILVETYDVAYCRGCKVGYLHTLVRQYVRDGKPVLYGSKKLTLQIARFGQVVEQWMEEATVESPDGKIFSTSNRQGLGKNQMLSLVGKVTKDGLEVTIEGGPAGAGAKELVKWPDDVLGIAKEATLLKDTRPKPGVSVEYRVYFGQLNGIITYRMTAKPAEEVEVNGKPRKLVKVIQQMKPHGDFTQPPVTYWVDPDTYEPVKLETDMPMFGGVMTAVRTTREVALAKPTKYLDLGDVQSIKLAAAVPGIHQKDAVTYRITLAGEFPLDRAFPSDARQKVTVVDAQARVLDLAVTALRTPGKVAEPAPGKEYLADCFYIDWDNELVKKHAAAAVSKLPATATAWDKARAVEAWVHANMRQVEFSQAMGTCKNTARELSGDCTEHAMLAAGMCRALGIPSKTALGLVYAPAKDGGATLAYHMWFEVYADGGWLALDAIMGLGSVGPGHVKITDAHWDGEKGFTPLLPVLGVLGSSPKVEVVK